MNLLRFSFFWIFCLSLSSFLSAQEMTQTVRGRVLDVDSEMPLVGATVVLMDTHPTLGGVTDMDGYFTINQVAIGRYDLKVSFIGYKDGYIANLAVTSAKELVLEVGLKESISEVGEIVVRAAKDKPLNSMAMLSARSFNMEEAKRYAGSLDDPGRLASAFAGVTSSGVESNAIMVRGNSPGGVLWRVEGVDVPIPSHFEGGDVMGGGFVTLFSNQLMAKSDFLTGAFPSEYGNATAGVFDIKLRNGNNKKREHMFQAGVLGIDFSSEGPFKKGGKASYLFNYRYSTFGLMNGFLPDDEGIPAYQDFSYKINLPTKKAGDFSLWAVSGIDDFEKTAKDNPDDWTENDMRKDIDHHAKMGTFGLGHRLRVGKQSYLKSTLAVSGLDKTDDVKWMQDNMELMDQESVDKTETRVAFTSALNHKFSARHTNRTGFSLSAISYDFKLQAAPLHGEPMETIVDRDGSANLMQFFTQSKFDVTDKLSFNIGIHSQYWGMNEEWTLEPRAGMSYQLSPRHSFSLAYGLHTQTIPLEVHQIDKKDDNGHIYRPNEKLDNQKSHHFVMAYNWNISPNLRFTIEPYYQRLYDVAVVPNSPVALINEERLDGFDQILKSNGTGRNVGVDLTLERYFKDDFYFLMTSSFFDSKYKGGDGVTRNTRYNKNFVVNMLGGKEWQLGQSGANWFGVNGRLYLVGGERTSPVLYHESEEAKEVIYDQSRLYENQHPSNYRVDLGVSLRRNKPKYTSTWSLSVMNLLMADVSNDFNYNFKTGKVEKQANTLILPVLSYRIQF